MKEEGKEETMEEMTIEVERKRENYVEKGGKERKKIRADCV